MNRTISLVAATLACVVVAASAHAAETLRVGKAVAEAFSFVPLDIGIRKGFFEDGQYLKLVEYCPGALVSGTRGMWPHLPLASPRTAHYAGPAGRCVTARDSA